MLITALEPVTKKRSKLYLDEQPVCVVYPRDIRKYHIVVGEELQPDMWETMYQELILHRAKQKAMALLVKRDYSEHDMRCKLRRADYCARAVEDTIAFLYAYHYLDDERYAEQFVRAKGERLGRSALVRRLRSQGIAEEVIACVYAEADICEEDVLVSQVEKKLAGRQVLDEKEYRSVVSYFLRRGFSYAMVANTLCQLGVRKAFTTWKCDDEFS